MRCKLRPLLKTHFFSQLLTDSSRYQFDQGLSGLRHYEGAPGGIPIQFEAPHLGRHPDLAHRRIWTDDELRGWCFKLDHQRPAAEIGFEIVPLTGGRKPPVEVFEGVVGARLKLLFVHVL